MKSLIIAIALSIVSGLLQSLGMPSLIQMAVALGRAFGPDGCIHFSELSPEKQVLLLQRAPILKTFHTDWPKAFQWVPRILTCWVTPLNTPPAIIYTDTSNKASVIDIPLPGTFVATRGYVALTTDSKFHMRFGWRWDVIDSYLEFPSFTLKQR